MPSFLALILASCAGFLTNRLPLPFWVANILATAVWLAVFIYTKRLLRNLRP